MRCGVGCVERTALSLQADEPREELLQHTQIVIYLLDLLLDLGGLHAFFILSVSLAPESLVTDVDILGMMWYWGLTIDSVSVINLVLAIGLLYPQWHRPFWRGVHTRGRARAC